MALATFGCATSQLPALRAQRLASRLERYEYTLPLSEVWPQAEQVLFSRGLKFRTLNIGADSRTLETEDRPVKDGG